MSCFLALDQGTTSSRALLFDRDGRELARAQHEVAQHFPRPGHVEHDAEEIFATQWRAAVEAHERAGRPEVAAVGLTNQRETTVVFDRKTGRPVHRAIVWQDRRTAADLRRMAEHGHGPRVLELTGLPLDPYFSAAKIARILDEVPGARQAAERGELGACTVDAWLLFKLTDGEVFATEPSNAARTSLYDLDAGDWSDELCELFSVPRACLPEIRPSAGEFGRVAATGWPLCAMLGDQQAALFGQGCLEVGASKCTYGTGAFLLTNCGAVRPAPRNGLLATVAWRIGARDTFALEGSVMIAGALVQWLRDGLGMISAAAEVEELARSVEDSDGVVLVPAFAGLGTPYWDPDARGLLIGMTRGTQKAHIARAALEAIALQVREVQLAVESTLERPFTELRVDGGAVANELLLQIQATLGNVRVLRPQNLETTALGASRMAMLGSGAVRSAADLPALEATAQVVEPGAGLVDPERKWELWRAAVSRCRGWAALSPR